jgi:DNA recombination protein RmuC
MIEVTAEALHRFPVAPAVLALCLVAAGGFLFLLLRLLRRALQEALDQALIREQERRKAESETLVARVAEAVGRTALEVQARNNETFLQLARETLSQHTLAAEKDLESKRQQIEQSLESLRGDMRKLEETLASFERDRTQKYGELREQLSQTAEFTRRLQETTQGLREALSSSKARGQWGERMAEDILRLAGLVEGVNYLKQRPLEVEAGRPDYTFLLPRGLKLHMDVKFPLDNYLRYRECGQTAEASVYRDRFLRDVRARIREVTTRAYIHPAENTLDYALLFIPNEQVYAFIQEEDRSLLDEALKNHVVLCSPLTLYAVLLVIRQAVDSFNLEQKAAEILSALGIFEKQWEAFVLSLEKTQKRMEDVRKEFEHLLTTRRNQLERTLRSIDDLRKQKGLSTSDHPTEGNSSSVHGEEPSCEAGKQGPT